MSFIRSLWQGLNGIVGIDVIENPDMEDPEDPPTVFMVEKKDSDDLQYTPSRGYIAEDVSISIYEPQTFDDVKEYADKLKSNTAVIVNYNYIIASEARKIYYFLQGCVYALNGSWQKISANIILYIPKSTWVQDSAKLYNTSLDDTLRFVWKDM